MGRSGELFELFVELNRRNKGHAQGFKLEPCAMH